MDISPQDQESRNLGSGSRKSIFISALADKAKQGRDDRNGGWRGRAVFCGCVQSVISLMKWSINRAKPPGWRFQEAQDRMSVASGSSG